MDMRWQTAWVGCLLVVWQGLPAVSGELRGGEQAATTGQAAVMQPSASSDQLAAPVSPTDGPEPTWAQDYLDDSLAGRETVTLEDLTRALDDPAIRDVVIERHWQRVTGATPEQQVQFLRQALYHDSPRVRRQAAEALQKLGSLEQVVAGILLDMARTDDVELRRIAVIALENMELGAGDLPAEYWQAMLDSLISPDDPARYAAESRLEAVGARAVPMLLELLENNPDPAVRRAAAALLTRIVGTRQRPIAMGGPMTETPSAPASGAEPGAPAPPPKKAAATRAQGPRTLREVDKTHPEVVRVYFGTNRETLPPTQRPLRPLIQFALLFTGAVIVTGLAWRLPTSHHQQGRRRGCLPILLALIGIATAVWSAAAWNAALRDYGALHTGLEFGPRRDRGGRLHRGYCDVSLPPTHQIGAVEGPLFGLEDEAQDVILKNTSVLDDQAFYSAVRAELDRQTSGSRDCFVFVHGYNVTFANAARRTAQIHYDLKFRGAPLFFSWPSRGSFRHYFSDRNEIDNSRRHLQQFLTGVAERLDADRIHVVAHSMGADVLSRAIRDMGDTGRIFDQIILAAPDIDADVFREDIAPRLVASSRRTTMYCSHNDWALHASYAFNDSPRAGDSSRGMIVLDGLDTIDASEIDTDLLGHSYYGDCLPLLHDVELLLEKDLPPQERRLRPWPAVKNLVYWTFGD